MQLYAFRPDGYGPHSFYTIAESEADARRAVAREVELMRSQGLGYETDGWPDQYVVSSYAPGAVAGNSND